MNYKELLLKYLTGNIDKQDKNTSLNYDDLSTKNSNIGIAPVFAIEGNIQCKDINGNLNGKTIIYGNTTQDYNVGFIALFKDTELVYVTTQYNTGTPLGQLRCLDVDENGNYYGIDYADNGFRVILLNNVSELGVDGAEQIVLRNSYYLRGSIADLDVNYTKFYISKSIQSASYMILGIDENNYNLKASLFKINVGSPNEWIDFTISVSFQDVQYLNALNNYVYFDKDDNPFIELYALRNKNNNKTELVLYTNNDTDIDTEEILVSDVKNLIEASSGYFYGDARLLPIAPKHYYLFLSSVSGEAKAKVWEFNNISSNVVFDMTTGSGTFDFTPQAYLFNINNSLIIYYLFPIDTNSQITPGESSQGIGIIDDNINVIKQFPNLISDGSIRDNIVLINNAYNMFKLSSVYYIVEDNDPVQKTSTWTLVYNPLNYNNTPYENINSLVGNNGMLFDSNNNLIFARNLYNYKVYNNRVISTLNVPNTYLNNTTIDKQYLLSETNSTMIEDNTSITKNIYEDLYINDFITLVMENQNENISIENKSGAIHLTQSAFKNKDYEHAKATKIKITYSDDTYFITSTSGSINNGIATYNINIYAPLDKEIEKIDILSEDESIIYQTITNETIEKLNIQGGKYYHISQDVRIE